MPGLLRHNLELKARCSDLRAAAEHVRQFGALSVGVERQTDTYFRVPHGRLKLREIDVQSAVLIWYERPDQPSAKSSRYYLVAIAEPAQLREALAAGLGIRGVVKKRREIWLYENLRIHLDEVAGLGCFIEFEAVLSDGADLAASQALLDRLGNALGIEPANLLAASYADLSGL